MNSTSLLSKNNAVDHLPAFIQTNIPLHDKNWFGTGGAAHYFCEPKTPQEFSTALAFAHQHQLPTYILGEGANVLISDAGFAGLIIRPRLLDITFSDTHVTAGAGASLAHVIEVCLDNGLIGLEEFSGIPGTIGGAVFINLHYFEFLIAQFLVHAVIIDAVTGVIQTVDNAWFNFSYNYSTLHTRTHYLVCATFALTRTSPDLINFARGRRHEIIRHRARRYPTARTCGSFFRVFHPEEVTLVINTKNDFCWLLS